MGQGNMASETGRGSQGLLLKSKSFAFPWGQCPPLSLCFLSRMPTCINSMPLPFFQPLSSRCCALFPSSHIHFLDFPIESVLVPCLRRESQHNVLTHTDCHLIMKKTNNCVVEQETSMTKLEVVENCCALTTDLR